METRLLHFFKSATTTTKTKSQSIAKGNKERVVTGMGNVFEEIIRKGSWP